MSDKDCSTRKFCLKPRDEKPFCAACRGPRRRCQRAAMCCPGTLCVNGESARSLPGPPCSDEAETAPGSLRPWWPTTGTLYRLPGVILEVTLPSCLFSMQQNSSFPGNNSCQQLGDDFKGRVQVGVTVSALIQLPNPLLCLM